MSTTQLDPAIKEVWAKRILKRSNAMSVMMPLVNTDFEGEIKNGGDVVHARYPGDVTINNYTRETDITYQTLQWLLYDLTIDQQKYWAFQIDDLDKAQIDVDVVNPELDQAAIKIRNVKDARLLGHYANTDTANVRGSTAAPIQLTADNIYKEFSRMMTLIANQNPHGTKFRVVVPPFIRELIVNSPQLSNRSTNLVDETIQNGLSVKNFAGFEVHVTTNYSLVSGTFPILFFTEWFISYADQVSKVEMLPQLQNRFAGAARGLFLYGSTVFLPYDGEGAVMYVDSNI